MQVYYSDRYSITLPENHRFPMEKYRLLRETLVARNIVSEHELFEPSLASFEDLTLAHTTEYVTSVFNGSIEKLAIRRIGFPWSEDLVARSRATVAGCLSASEAALADGISGNLAGGTHHALRSAGEGFCVFNDIAVSALKLLKTGRVASVLVVDLDVHQGNGNSDILGNNPAVSVFSMHGEKNYPFVKVPSTVDVALPDGTGDEEYLALLDQNLPVLIDAKPDICFYQCGVDPLASDTLGRLSLSFEGLMERDRRVISACKQASIPVVLTLGGGYAKPINDTIDAHCNTYRVARDIFAGV